MKYILILGLFAGLFSCSPYYHIKKAKKHTQKAISKGVEPESNTTYVVTSDTLIEVDTLDNYIRITKTVRDTVREECKTVYIAKSRTEVRHEQKTARTEIRQKNKTDRKQLKNEDKKDKREARAERKEKRSLWWLWLLAGGLLTLTFQKLKSRLWR